MDDYTLKQKNEILQWLLTVEDLQIIRRILDIKKESEQVVSESHSEYAVKDDFEERWARGLTPEESKARTVKYLQSLPWKK